jgi:hypothetical protein
MKKKCIILVNTVALAAVLSFAANSCSKKIEHYELSRFIPPSTCGGCHDSIYSQWSNSTHNLAHKDPIYRKASMFFLKGLTDKDEITEAETCVKCHTPIGVFSGYPKKTSDDQDRAPEIAKEGVQCDFCHSSTGAYNIYNNEMKLDPGRGDADPGSKRGPRQDAKSSYHKSEFSKFHAESEICGVCHNVKHEVFGTMLESTFDEWKNSPYNSGDHGKRVTCQGCHMYQKPGIPATGSTLRPKNPGASSSDGPTRDHVFTHYFIGGNTLIPSSAGDKAKARMAEERLKNAAEIKIDASKIKDRRLLISIKNTGAGHYLPTGLTDTRQMWLQVKVTDDKGRAVYSTGTQDNNGYLQQGTIIYNTVFGDGKGNPVDNVSKARQILRDRRIAPMESLTEKIVLPEVRGKYLTVSARLMYMSVSQELTDRILGKGKLKIPSTLMADAVKKVEL